MDPKVKDCIDTFKKIIDTHIEATKVQLAAFPKSKYWLGQLDSLKNVSDALFDLAEKKS